MLKPVYYMQTDPKWKNANYSAPGEKKTIGSSGCGITCSAMAIATLKNSKITPLDTAKWSMNNGYKALNQGTYYTYFVPQFKKYGINCKMLNQSNLYGKSTSPAHTEALKQLKAGNWLITCMGKGLWTSSGHFILVYGYKDGYVYINDPASKRSDRIKNTWELLSKQIKYMWSIEVPNPKKSNQSTTQSANKPTTKISYTKTQFIKDIEKLIGAKVDGVIGEVAISKLPIISKDKNNEHSSVKYLQKYLNQIGYKLSVTNIYDNATFVAVTAYQKKMNLKSDGVVGTKTWTKLLT